MDYGTRKVAIAISLFFGSIAVARTSPRSELMVSRSRDYDFVESIKARIKHHGLSVFVGANYQGGAIRTHIHIIVPTEHHNNSFAVLQASAPNVFTQRFTIQSYFLLNSADEILLKIVEDTLEACAVDEDHFRRHESSRRRDSALVGINVHEAVVASMQTPEITFALGGLCRSLVSKKSHHGKDAREFVQQALITWLRNTMYVER